MVLGALQQLIVATVAANVARTKRMQRHCVALYLRQGCYVFAAVCVCVCVCVCVRKKNLKSYERILMNFLRGGAWPGWSVGQGPID